MNTRGLGTSSLERAQRLWSFIVRDWAKRRPETTEERQKERMGHVPSVVGIMVQQKPGQIRRNLGSRTKSTRNRRGTKPSRSQPIDQQTQKTKQKVLPIKRRRVISMDQPVQLKKVRRILEEEVLHEPRIPTERRRPEEGVLEEAIFESEY